jgi:hypothetical protein
VTGRSLKQGAIRAFFVEDQLAGPFVHFARLAINPLARSGLRLRFTPIALHIVTALAARTSSCS